MSFFTPRVPLVRWPISATDTAVAAIECRNVAFEPNVGDLCRSIAFEPVPPPRLAAPVADDLARIAKATKSLHLWPVYSLSPGDFAYRSPACGRFQYALGQVSVSSVDFALTAATSDDWGIPIADPVARNVRRGMLPVIEWLFSVLLIPEFKSQWFVGIENRTADEPTDLSAPPKPLTHGVKISIETGDLQSIDVSLPPPSTRGRVYCSFAPRPLKEAAEHSRREASRNRPPDDDPFANLYYLLLAKKNWDIRVVGLKALLAAYPEDKRPFPFQLEGIAFLAPRSNALLCDDMGLGKTIQAILAMRALIHRGDIQRVLIVCPKSLLANWYAEVATWAPELSVRVLHGNDKYAGIKAPHHVYITNYETVGTLICDQHNQHRYSVRPFDMLIVDEAHNLKNPSTKRARSVGGVSARVRWGLTGTPIENRFDDYRAIWQVIAPNMAAHRLDDRRFLSATKSDVLRRVKNEVLEDLPDKITRVQYLELEGAQRDRYDFLEENARREAKSSEREPSNRRRTHVWALISELKQACIYEPGSRTSAKLDFIEELLEEMHPVGLDVEKCEKALIYTQYPKLVWDEWQLQKRLERYAPMRYDGSVSDTDRFRFAKVFENNENRRLAFMGIQAGATGLTLTRASQVVFLDEWWNPAVMEQAAARVHRIGQHRTCYVTLLVAKDTVEERIMEILRRKQALFDAVTKEIKDGKKSVGDIEGLAAALTLDDMLEALGLPREKRPGR